MIRRALLALALLAMLAPLMARAEALSVHAATGPDTATLRFEWPRPAAAAVFTRAGAVWIVFDRAASVDLKEVQALPGGMIAAAEQLPAAGGTVLRLSVRAGLAPVVRRSRGAWVVELRPGSAGPVVAPVLKAQSSPAGPRLIVAAQHPAPAVSLRDPASGERFIVLPLADLGIGIATEQRFAGFSFIPSAQGIVLHQDTDDLRISQSAEGFEISRPDGLELSPEDQKGRSAPEAGPLLDFAAWRGDDAKPFLERRRELEQAIAAAPQAQRLAPRLALARFYFAHLYAAEAEGVLDAIRHDPSGQAEGRGQLLMAGAAALLNGDSAMAAQALGRPLLDREPEAQLWRAALAAETGQWTLAAESFLAGTAFLPLYPKPVRDRLALDAAEALIETGHAEKAVPMIGLVLEGDPSRATRAMALYLDGRRALAQHDLERALALWDESMALDDAPSRTRAASARAMALLEAGRIARGEAVATLDGLRFAWRGDRVELLVLRALGELRLTDGDPQGGLAALRSAALDFPDDALAPEIARELGQKLSDLLQSEPQEVTPLQAVALYEEYKDFLPLDAAGDRATEHLIDRLIALDLPARAASLLEGHVRRLAGVERERAAIELARLRLLDQNPEAALRALDLAGDKELGVELRHRRQELRAQALAALHREAEAFAALFGDASTEAEKLRVEIAWQRRDWRAAADGLAHLVGTRPPERTPSAEGGRWVVDWAAALVLAGDRQGLARLRERYAAALAGTPLADAFRLLVTEADDPGGDRSRFAAGIARSGDAEGMMAALRQSRSAPGNQGASAP